MNREFKFRAWSTQENAMLQIGDEFGTTHPLDCAVYAKQGQPVVLMQFTGLHDTNGVEIYEGDVITDWSFTDDSTFYRSDVTFERGCFVVKCDSPGIHSNDVFTGYHLLAEGDSESFQVIGNIYEHPHLLDA